MNKNLKTVLQGVVMGIVEVIPGVSASTLALIMGIYHQFVDTLHEVSDVFKEVLLLLAGKSTIKSIRHKILAINLKFGGFLFLGMLIGIGVFSHIMSYLLENQAAYTYAFFFGLIVASIPVPWGMIKKKTQKEYLITFITAAAFFLFLGLNPINITGIPSPFYVFIAGFFAICAMVLPGISGSFVLLLFGVYNYVIEAVKHLTKLQTTGPDLVNLFALGFGLLLGFATFVRFLKYVLLNHQSYLMSFLVGLMIGSLRVIWPFDKISPTADFEFELMLVLLVIIVTAGIVFGVNALSAKQRPVLKEI